MITYLIANWKKTFENNRTKELKKLTWVPVPNSHDGHGYAYLLSLKNGPALYGAWQAILQVASRCEPRGTLLRAGKIPHTATSLALMTRFPEGLISECLKVCSGDEIGWIICEKTNETEFPAGECDCHAQSCDDAAPDCLEGKGREGNGKNEEKEFEPPPFYNEARIVLHLLNEKSGSRFREVDTNLSMIAARLKSVDGDLDGMKLMVERQCRMWKGDDRMERYLQPSTLFGPENFEKYWGPRYKPLDATPPLSGFSKSPPAPNIHFVRKNEDDFIDHKIPDSPV